MAGRYGMKIEEAIERIETIIDRQMEESAYHGGRQTRPEALGMAVEALQKQIPKEPCEYCKGEKRLLERDNDGYAEIVMHVGGGSVNWRIFVEVKDGFERASGLFDIDFCPKCGRQLK
jgi:hypothetical protein